MSTNIINFLLWGTGSFVCWDYMIRAGSPFYKKLPKSLKALFLIFVPAVTAAYLNLTQMWHLQRLLGKDKSRYYLKIMALMVISSNGILWNGIV